MLANLASLAARRYTRDTYGDIPGFFGREERIRGGAVLRKVAPFLRLGVRDRELLRLGHRRLLVNDRLRRLLINRPHLVLRRARHRRIVLRLSRLLRQRTRSRRGLCRRPLGRPSRLFSCSLHSEHTLACRLEESAQRLGASLE